MTKALRKTTRNHMWDWLSAILLIILMEIAAARLVATLWTLDLNLVLVVTFFGTILGLALGISRFKRFWVAVLASLYGVILIPWQLGLTSDPDINWRDRLINLWGRLELIFQELATRKPITDSLLFLLLMAMLFWCLSIYSGVVLVREKNPWKVVIPGGVAAFIINSFDALLVVRSIYLAVYLLFALFIVARMVYLKNTAKWIDSHTHTPPDIGFDLTRVAIVLSMVLVLFAWNIPVLAGSLKPAAELWRSTSRPWLSLKDRLSFIFASLRASATTVQNYYSDTLSLGLGNPLSDQVIMEVEAPTDPPAGLRFYWEARSYDTFVNSTWSSSIQSPHNLTPTSNDLNQPGVDVRTVVSFTFYPYSTISNIYTVSEPLWTSLPSRAFMDTNPDGTVNLSALMSRSFIRPGEQYTVRSALDTVTVKQLQDAGNDYPAWVTNEYLQLPPNITQRTKDLAKTISSGSTNAYDIANAVTQYLRENIQYDLSISPPPVNQERIDWFLFDYKKGFCNYYASAEVVLLRSLGIPARIAVGFAQGEREPNPVSTQPVPPPSGSSVNQQPVGSISTYVVRQKDAHAWPEVFFPGIGWVIFEPTASQTALSRPSGQDAASYDLIESGRGRANPPNRQELGSEQQLPNSGSSGTGPQKSFWTTGNIILFALFQFAVGISIILIWQYMRGFRIYAFLERVSIEVPEKMEKALRRLGIPPPGFLVNWIYYNRLPAPSRSYLEINHALDRMGIKPAVQDTPTDRVNSLISTIPASEIPARQLLAEYQSSVYSPHPADSVKARKYAVEIRNLSWKAWLSRFLSRFRLPRRQP